MNHTRIVRIDLTPLHVPFHKHIRELMSGSEGGLGMAIPAEEEWLGGDFVVCALHDEEGRVGWSEVFVWLPETGASPAQIVDIIAGSLSRYVLGESPFNVERIAHRMESNVARSEAAKGLLDMACYDLAGRTAGLSVCELVGGPSVREVPLCALIPLMDTDSMLGIGRMFFDEGYRSFRLKLGTGLDEDVERIRAFRDAFGSGIRLRVDYNQAYRPADAVRAIKAIEPYGIDFAEQPVAAADFAGMAYIQRLVDTPLMAHEGCFSLGDFIALADLGAVRLLGLNSERPGGLTMALKAIAVAESRGMGTVIHNQPLGLASAMHLHLAAARYHSLGHAVELFGHIMMEDDLIVTPIDYSGGRALLPDGPGWGVEVDLDALERYKTAETTTLTE
ncbi:MAG TPA: mandelate racemase/muconate lactonizing enzyme family protein [Spirochaetota bacterium]|nr:mandelate racemase/muconate lactonizing enzyme family protein [Spirochaetota bacterium]HNU91715.1 mandelate racemase/muconate lactonizing enzyme family protein [Spirochaetota bacterium]HPI14258.1 mandelate racemase/muconate lactonizing enzyme family protein [Spirochaetota bacterium]HPO46386.1 mandelate racemase/muconate lactonizing enzyme family protein [Spirochaetota bacterium]HPV96361.1 mandelate racemase/muconate lactonizing enzyme family protein [Spirochaetota bacterium]